jgi:hypothetical protein
LEIAKPRPVPPYLRVVAAVSLVHEAGIHSGVNMELGPALHNSFQETGLPAPRMRLEMDLRRDPDFTRWVSDLLRSAFPQIQKLNFSQEALGDFDTLQKELQDEVAIKHGCTLDWPSGSLVSEARRLGTTPDDEGELQP